MHKIIKLFSSNFRIFWNTIFHFLYIKSLKVYWYNDVHNFGDALNPKLINMLSGKNVFCINISYFRHKNYIIMGSILHEVNKYSIVWGAGFISQESICNEKPLKVCAVRGPLSREKLLKLGIDCPEVYGDPALLLPYLYMPNKQKRYKLGIVAHYKNKNDKWLNSINDSDVLLLDIQCSNPFDFIDQVLQCEKIASSSLHGLIVADAYGIPSLWLEFSDKIRGEGFKFFDYFLSVHRTDKKPFVITEQTNIEELISSFRRYEINIDLLKLLNSCPFDLTESFKKNLIRFRN